LLNKDCPLASAWNLASPTALLAAWISLSVQASQIGSPTQARSLAALVFPCLNDPTASQWPNEKATGCCTTAARAMTQRVGCSTVLSQIQLPALKLNLLPTEIEIHGAQSGSLMPKTNSSFFPRPCLGTFCLKLVSPTFAKSMIFLP
jgi:hypothetical protein